MKIKTIINNLFKKKEIPEEYVGKTPLGTAILFHQSDIINDIYDMISNENKQEYDARVDYLSEKFKKDRDYTILKHSNILIYMEIPNDYSKELEEILSNEYIKVLIEEEKGIKYTIFSSSLYGYKQLIHNTINQNNKLIKEIMILMYQNNKCLFEDFIEYGIMNKRHFGYFSTEYTQHSIYDIGNDELGILNIDDLQFNNDKKYMKLVGYVLSHFKGIQLLDILRVSIKTTLDFKDISFMFKYNINAFVKNHSTIFINLSIKELLLMIYNEKNRDLSKRLFDMINENKKLPINFSEIEDIGEILLPQCIKDANANIIEEYDIDEEI